MASYLLQIFNAPGVSTVDEAMDFVARPARSAASDEWRMARFMSTLIQRHPLYATEFKPGVWTPPLWLDNPLSAPPDPTLFTLALPPERVLHHQVIGEIALLATSVGLQVLDPQERLLYRSDGIGVGQQGPVKGVNGLPLPLETEELTVRLSTRLAERLGAHGWSLCHFWGQPPRVSRALGPCGDIRQTLVLHPKRSEEGFWRESISVELSCARVSFVWQTLFGATINNVFTGGFQVEPDFTLIPCDFDKALFSAPPTHPAEFVLSRPEDETPWLDNIVEWYASGLGPDLDRCSNLRAVAASVFDPERFAAPSELFRHPSQAMSALVLARAVDWPQFDALVDAIMMRFHEDTCRDWESRLHDQVGWHLDALVTHLRSADFSFDPDRPQWAWPQVEASMAV